MAMDLTNLVDLPELTVAIAGQDYHFSELPLGKRALLQAWIAAHVPNPMEQVKAELAGLAAEDRQYLLNEARKERQHWPPDVETARGKIALLSTEPGQVEALVVGLSVHHPEITRGQATKLFKQLERETAAAARAAKAAGLEYNGESTIQRIYATLFGLSLPSDDEGLPVPK
jgi:hypothetical protein